MRIERMTDGDWQALEKLELEAFGDAVAESADVLRSHWLAAPDSCFVARDDEALLGFLLAHTWGSEVPPALHQHLTTADCEGDILFLHSLVVAQEAAGKGVGTQLVERLLYGAKEQGFQTVLLVAVQGADSYWSRFGFVETTQQADASYGAVAVVMQRPV